MLRSDKRGGDKRYLGMRGEREQWEIIEEVTDMR